MNPSIVRSVASSFVPVAILCATLTAGPASAQTWSREFDAAGLVAVDADGSLVLVGNRSATFTPRRQLVVTRLAPSGAMLATTVAGFENDDRGRDVAMLPDGAIVIGTAHRLEGGHDTPTDPNLAVVVLEADLTLRWQAMLLVPSFDYEPRVLPRDDGGVVLSGDADPAGTGSQDVWLTRFAADGEVVWQRTWGSALAERPQDLVAMPDGGFAVAGYVEASYDDRDLMLARFDALGGLLWARRYGVFGAGFPEFGRAVAAAPDGSLYVVGQTSSYGGVGEDWLIVKTDGEGVVSWARRVDGARNGQSAGDTVRSATADADGLVVVGGRPADASDHDPWAMRIDGDGSYVWSRVWPTAGNDEGVDVDPTPEGGWLVATQGVAVHTGPGSLFRTDADGGIGASCDPGNYNGVLPLPVAVESAELSWQSTETVIEPSREPWYESVESFDARAGCIGPPGEVSRPGAATLLRFATPDRLAWEEARHSNSGTFDLYRGNLADLRDGLSPECIEPGLTVPEAIDTDVPSGGAGFGYLVGGRNEAGLGTLGSASDGTPRPNDAPCP